MREPFPFEPQYRYVAPVAHVAHPRKAVRLLSRVVAERPDLACHRWDLGYAYLDAGAPERSVEHLLHAVRLDPECRQAWGGLGHAYVELGEWDLAAHAFERRLAVREDAAYHLFLCDVLRALGDYAGALRCSERALALGPCYAEAYLNLGLTYRCLRLWDEAAGAFEKAIELDPTDPRPIGELGLEHVPAG